MRADGKKGGSKRAARTGGRGGEGETARNHLIQIRVSEEEFALLERMARADDERPIATWVRIQVVKAARAAEQKI